MKMFNNNNNKWRFFLCSTHIAALTSLAKLQNHALYIDVNRHDLTTFSNNTFDISFLQTGYKGPRTLSYG